jgi:hypothetical protein
MSLASEIQAYHDGPIARVAEIGAGTGKGTQVLLRLGGELTCIEPDPLMAAHLPPSNGVDVLACAMAWHWTQEQGRYERALAALAPHGTLAIFSHKFAFAHPGEGADLEAAYASVPDRHLDHDQFWYYREIAHSGLFGDVRCSVTHRDWPLSTEQYVALTGTLSPFLRRPKAEQQTQLARLRAAIDGFGGTVTIDLRTTLVLAKARSHSPGGEG